MLEGGLNGSAAEPFLKERPNDDGKIPIEGTKFCPDCGFGLSNQYCRTEIQSCC